MSGNKATFSQVQGTMTHRGPKVTTRTVLTNGCTCTGCKVVRLIVEDQARAQGEGQLNVSDAMVSLAHASAYLAAEVIDQFGPESDPLPELFTLTQAELYRRRPGQKVALKGKLH